MSLAFLSFLDSSPTSWHAARSATNALAESEFIPLLEHEKWDLERGKGYFLVRDGSAVCAFRVPKGAPKRLVLLASHLDSPSLKLKPIPDVAQNRLAQFSTEVYGSPLLHTWLDRDLCIAGRVAVRSREGLETHLVRLDDYPLIIPSLAIHLDRSVADKGLMLNRQDHLKPIASISRSKQHPVKLEGLLRKHLCFEELLAFDLFLTPLEKAAYLGDDAELIASARLDNLSSAYACLEAMKEAAPSDDAIQMALFWDHEEVGSRTYPGAESLFAAQALERICLAFGIDREELFRLKSRSYCASVDAAHGYHPNYPDRYDPCNAPNLGDGVVLKTNAMQRYATTASTAAPLLLLSRKLGIPLQKFATRSDIPSGSTVGPAMSVILDLPTADIGAPLWAMHSIRETVSAQDQTQLGELLKALLQENPCI